MVYATLDDYIAMFGAVKAEDEQRITTLLNFASVYIRTLGVDPEPTDPDTLEIYKFVVCSMVRRVVISPAWAVGGVSQHSQTAGQFTESYSFRNPNGDLYLTSSEEKLLGLNNRSVIFSIEPIVHEYKWWIL